MTPEHLAALCDELREHLQRSFHRPLTVTFHHGCFVVYCPINLRLPDNWDGLPVVKINVHEE